MARLVDGTGKAYANRVDQRHNSHVQSRSLALPMVRTLEGWMFNISTPIQTITATGGRIAWLNFQETTKKLLIHSLVFNWNGGNTNHNRCVKAGVYIGDTAPTTNITASQVINTNTNSQNTFEHTAYIWDEVGNGMTGFTAGVALGGNIYSQGQSSELLNGAWLIGPNTTMSINAQAEEEGLFSFSANFCLIDPTEEDWLERS